MQVNLCSGKYNIIDSGYAFLFGKNEDFSIHITADNDFKISIILKF